jgi:hypothetical protein
MKSVVVVVAAAALSGVAACDHPQTQARATSSPTTSPGTMTTGTGVGTGTAGAMTTATGTTGARTANADSRATSGELTNQGPVVQTPSNVPPITSTTSTGVTSPNWSAQSGTVYRSGLNSDPSNPNGAPGPSTGLGTSPTR